MQTMKLINTTVYNGYLSDLLVKWSAKDSVHVG